MTVFTRIDPSVKTVTTPSGNALLLWSLGCWSSQSVASGYEFRPFIDGLQGNESVLLFNLGSLHLTTSGMNHFSIPAGTHEIGLEVRRIVGTGTLVFDVFDTISWTLIVFRN